MKTILLLSHLIFSVSYASTKVYECNDQKYTKAYMKVEESPQQTTLFLAKNPQTPPNKVVVIQKLTMTAKDLSGNLSFYAQAAKIKPSHISYVDFYMLVNKGFSIGISVIYNAQNVQIGKTAIGNGMPMPCQ